MNLLLIRHTEPHLIDGVCYGQTDLPLKVYDFLNKRKQILKQITQLSIDWEILYSSPLTRCKQLAQYLQKKIQLPLILHDSLKEFNYGIWEGKPYKEIEQEFTNWANDYVHQPTPQGESFYQFYSRVNDFYQANISLNKNIIIVTHLGVIRAFYLIYHKLPIEEFFRFKINYSDILLFKIY